MASGLSRRAFLSGAAGLAGVVLLGQAAQLELDPADARSLIPDTTQLTRLGQAPSPLEIFSAGYPRAFVYRQASTLAGILDYSTWLGQMAQLNGIIGKVLQEEEPVSANALTYFQQFKAKFPSKIVLLHFNGWERVPQWETTNWFPGFWLHKAGTKLAAPCLATDTTLAVGTTACFSMQASFTKNRGDDICIATMGSNGLPDFTYAEQVVLTGINAAAGTITVQRGMYGTTPLPFARGAFIAAHVTRGPFVGTGPMLWMYNFSTMAPKDPNGHTVIDAIIAGMAAGQGLGARFSPGGPLASFDGLKLDAFSWTPPLISSPDCNNDGIVDNGIFNGVNTFGLGEATFVQALRAILGSNRIIIVDGEDVSRQRPDSSLENGMELEGFPDLYDTRGAQWSEALTNLQYYNTTFTDTPALVYPNYKTDRFTPIPPPGTNNMFRLALAAALLADAEFTFYTDPDGATPINGKLTGLTVFDELVAGVVQTPNWLGQPLALAQHLSLQTDALGGAGVRMRPTFTARFQHAGNVKATYVNQGHPGATATFTGTGRPLPGKVSFTLTAIPVSPSGDLILTFDVMSTPQPAYSASLCRRLYVAATGNNNTQSTPTGGSWFSAILYFRGLKRARGSVGLAFSIEGPQAVTLRNIRAYKGPDVAFRQFQNGAVFANPSLAPYTFPVSLLAPGAQFSRLQATSGTGQDPVTNNGKPIGSTLIVPATDALIVIG